jgi:uncharacterized protein with HEPN domain
VRSDRDRLLDIVEAIEKVPWDKMIGMRHVLVHGYFQIDLDVVWAVMEKDLPPLFESLQRILASEAEL